MFPSRRLGGKACRSRAECETFCEAQDAPASPAPASAAGKCSGKRFENCVVPIDDGVPGLGVCVD